MLQTNEHTRVLESHLASVWYHDVGCVQYYSTTRTPCLDSSIIALSALLSRPGSSTGLAVVAAAAAAAATTRSKYVSVLQKQRIM